MKTYCQRYIGQVLLRLHHTCDLGEGECVLKSTEKTRSVSRRAEEDLITFKCACVDTCNISICFVCMSERVFDLNTVPGRHVINKPFPPNLTQGAYSPQIENLIYTSLTVLSNYH